MIEFFLSKFWAILCGLILLGAVTTSIDGLGDASEQRSQDEAFRSLLEEIESFLRLGGASTLVILVAEVIQSDEDFLEIRSGSVWLCGSSGNKAMTLSQGVDVLFDDGEPIQTRSIIVHMSDSVVLTKGSGLGACELRVQEANVSTTFLTDSTNMSQSLSSL